MKLALFVTISCLILSMATSQLNGQDRRNHGRLFPPEELGALEGPDRDAWQEPERVMDSLGVTSGTIVADIGAGGGWFTIKLANRVGPTGLVYAEDIQREMIESINRRVNRTNLSNVETIIGTSNNPKIPTPVDAVLMVDVYGEVEDPMALLRNVIPQLKKGGRIGIVEHRLDGGGPGPPLQDRVAPETIITTAEAVGLQLLTHDESFRYQYLLVFVENSSKNNSGTER
jgi:predicted methyltransferase